MKSAFYDDSLSYEDNYEKGPPIFLQNLTPPKRNIEKAQKFLGFDVNLPFGIPPGPLVNSEYMKAAFEWGYDVSTYKTVRSDSFPSHPFPNILGVDIKGELHPDQTPQLRALKKLSENPKSLNITNSFGVPSQPVATWQEDVKKALTYVRDGQLLILSFMGTVKPDQTQQEFIDDFAKAAELSVQTGAKVIEANLSCPNIGNEGLVCYNLQVTEEVIKAIRRSIGDTPLIIKIGYFKEQKDLEKLAEIANKYTQAIAAINTLQAEVVDENGNQALPGPNRLKSGICGAGIKWAGLEMVERLNTLRQQKGYSYEILGIGGVMTPEDYFDYRKAGADCVQSATGAMWNPTLAYTIWEAENTI